MRAVRLLVWVLVARWRASCTTPSVGVGRQVTASCTTPSVRVCRQVTPELLDSFDIFVERAVPSTEVMDDLETEQADRLGLTKRSRSRRRKRGVMPFRRSSRKRAKWPLPILYKLDGSQSRQRALFHFAPALLYL